MGFGNFLKAALPAVGGIAGAVIGGPAGAAAGGGIGAGISGMLGQEQANTQNKDLAIWQTQQAQNQSNTAYQRAMADMKAAGLNPMLAYSQGGASTSTGPMATMQNEMAPLQQGAASAADAIRIRQEIKRVDSQNKLNEVMANTQAAQAHLYHQNAMVAGKEAARLDATLPAVKARAKADEKEAHWDEKSADYDAIQKRVNNALNTGNSALDLFRPKFSPNRSIELDKYKRQRRSDENRRLEKAGKKGVTSDEY